jgi:hypothetical protein
MTGRAFLAAGLVLAAAFAGGAPASAHRLDAALSVVEAQPDGALEVTHRIYAHDLEHAMNVGPVGARWFETAPGQAALRDHVAARFHLRDVTGAPVPLRFVGAELSGDLVLVHFEGRTPEGGAVEVDSDILQDFSPRQINQVNVRRAGGPTRSATFPPGAAAVRLAFAR